ncbi:hypothetical protein [Burkholderia pyrrocinia]|uniref:hypothetical protein n=1 Tax=Burkholderia pyrrocinia TaxID=60550 RepID=UPI00158A94FC|nr:hypothetical protein [Burkholderia pyrrocinia]
MATILCVLYADPVEGWFDAAMIARMKRGAYLFSTREAGRPRCACQEYSCTASAQIPAPFDAFE